MTTDAYRRLAESLDRLPNGFPRTKSGVELKILQRIFSPEEARLASAMTGSPESAEAIARRVDLPQEEVAGRLKSMLSRGLLWGSGEAGVFRLAPYVVGVYESQLETIDYELAHLHEQYMNEGGAKGIMGSEPALHRVVPAQQALKTEIILPYDDVKSLILQSKSFVLNDCICRKETILLGNRKCDFPVRVCLSFTQVERPQTDRSITQKEALALLDKTEEIGMVHTVSNVARGVFYVCNCCGCCCGILRGITEFGLEHSVARANYYAVVDPEACAGCGTCEERCQVGACSVPEDISVVDLTKCLGCGICVTGCPNDAISLKPRPDAEIIQPPENFAAWEQQRLRNRGLLK